VSKAEDARKRAALVQAVCSSAVLSAARHSAGVLCWECAGFLTALRNADGPDTQCGHSFWALECLWLGLFRQGASRADAALGTGAAHVFAAVVAASHAACRVV
jgi:hypothetical protein